MKRYIEHTYPINGSMNCNAFDDQTSMELDNLLDAQFPALQTRAQLLLRALHCFYLGLGLFASSALISIAGSIVADYGGRSAFQMVAGIGVVCGASAVVALACGCVLMIRETQLAVRGLASEATSHLN